MSNIKTIPQFPNEIAIITGANTAALQDILTTIYNRWPLAKTTEIHALVQGQKAIESIVSAIKKANNTSADIIILARGGGSIDDLWCFNDESIAKAIFESQKPVITGIGHETDFTIADLVADFRAATPTQAAKATPDYREILNIINKCENIIVQTISNDLNKYNQLLDFHKNRLENYRNSIIKYKVEIDNLLNIALLNLKKKSELFKQNISNRKMIIELSLKSLIKYNSDYLENIAAMLIKSIDDKLHKCKLIYQKH